MNEQNNEEIRVYIGTYTHGDSEGIYVYRLNLSSGELEFESKSDRSGKPPPFWRSIPNTAISIRLTPCEKLTANRAGV